MTPMNHRTAIPAKGMTLSASATSVVSAASRPPDACLRIGGNRAPQQSEARQDRQQKATPAIAAALGVLNPASV
jgi:hypothetical protein